MCKIVEQAQRAVQGIGPQRLRDHDALRQHVASRLGEVQEQLRGVMDDGPVRSFRL